MTGGPATVVPAGLVPPGGAAYLDREWLRPGRTRATGIAVDPGAPDDLAVVAAMTALDAFVEEIMRAVGRPGASGEVIGSGIVAALVRRRIGPSAGAPGTIVDTTGDPDQIADAIRRLGDDGVLVLAGAPPAAALAIDPYPDLHKRSLSVVGVAPPPLGGGRAMAAGGDPTRVPDGLAEVAAGDPVPGGALWLRVRG